MTLVLAAAVMGLGLPGAALATPENAGSGEAQDQSADVTQTVPVVPESAGDVETQVAPRPGIGGSITLDNSLLGASIYANAYNANPSLSTNLYMRPDYSFHIGDQALRLQVWENLYFYDILDKSSIDTRRFDWSDLRITLIDGKIYEEPHTHIKLSGLLRATAPLSYASQFASTITTLSAGLALTKSLYGFDFTLGSFVAKEFHRYTTYQYSCSSSNNQPVALVPGEPPVDGFIDGICNTNDADSASPGGGSAVNVDWYIIPYGSASYKFTERLSLTLALYYYDAFKYPMPVDQFTSQVTDANGNQVATSVGRVDGFWGITDLSYAFTDHFSASIGIWNGANGYAPPLTNRGQQVRFPFLDFQNFNDWTAYLDLTATL